MTKTVQGAKKRGWRKAEIIAAAAECFMERGYHATKVDDVAARLGATKGRIYHHYASKTELFFDVHREGMARLFAAQEGIGAAGGPRDRLIAMLQAHARAMLEHHTFETVVAQGVQVHRFDQTTPEERLVMADLIATRDEFERLFKDALAAAIDTGEVAPRDVSIAVKMMLGALQWTLVWYRPRAGETDAERADLARRMVEAVITGL
ncbi:TetR/AcrR family transcriptional regulator [Pseudooceanicola sp.]|uniref:TetR/AcrR family transcriptional regulator n=1 Tax=Pseudooceanicola sp. TaxID=1914328 RepID=UPI0035C67635